MASRLTLTLTDGEAKALYDLGKFVLHTSRVHEFSHDPDARDLVSVMVKVKALNDAGRVTCSKCGEKSARKRGLCHRCYMKERRESA